MRYHSRRGWRWQFHTVPEPEWRNGFYHSVFQSSGRCHRRRWWSGREPAAYRSVSSCGGVFKKCAFIITAETPDSPLQQMITEMDTSCQQTSLSFKSCRALFGGALSSAACSTSISSISSLYSPSPQRIWRAGEDQACIRRWGSFSTDGCIDWDTC